MSDIFNFDKGRKSIVTDNLLKSYGVNQSQNSLEKGEKDKGLDSILTKLVKEYNEWCGEDCSEKDWFGKEASVLEFLQNNHEDDIDKLKDLIQAIKVQK